MFMHFIPSVELWDDEQIAEEDYDKINLTKLNLIEHGHFKNPLLAGIAVGLMSQIYDGIQRKVADLGSAIPKCYPHIIYLFWGQHSLN